MIRPMFFHFVSKLRQISGQRSLHRALLFAVRQRCVLYVRAFWSSRRRIGATKRSTHPTGNIGDSRSARNHRRAKSQSCGFRPQRPIPHPLIQMSGDQSKAATDRTPVHTTGTTYTPSPYILALLQTPRATSLVCEIADMATFRCRNDTFGGKTNNTLKNSKERTSAKFSTLRFTPRPKAKGLRRINVGVFKHSDYFP